MKSPDKDRPAILKSIKKLHKAQTLNLLANAAARWADEKEYEDFSDYIEHICTAVTCVVVEKVTKRPFAIHYKIGSSLVKFACYSKGGGCYESKVTATAA